MASFDNPSYFVDHLQFLFYCCLPVGLLAACLGRTKLFFTLSRAPCRNIHGVFLLLKSSWFNTPQLVAENWGWGGFVPPHTQIFQGEILNTPELAPGFFISLFTIISAYLYSTKRTKEAVIINVCRGCYSTL
jgi:hypothetical protein